MYFKKSFFVRLAVFLGCLCTALALHHDAHSQDSLETKLRTARDAENLALFEQLYIWLLYTSDAADECPCVDLCVRRLIKKGG
ncbi:MAG: hypothetical protein ACK514_17515, partial [Bacteroidota bacterium]